MVEVSSLIFVILVFILQIFVIYSIIVTNNNMVNVEKKLEKHTNDYAAVEEENQKIRKTTAIALGKISEHL